jgi:hypothetical protein
VQIPSTFDHSRKDLSTLKNFEIKFGHEGFEQGNKFLPMKFFRFDMDFELKFGELKVCF